MMTSSLSLFENWAGPASTSGRPAPIRSRILLLLFWRMASSKNLTVAKRPTPTKGSAKTKDAGDTYEVVAGGGRRLAALQSLAKQKKIPKDYPVPCKVIDGNGEEFSLVENTVRQAMHPADQFEAFHRLAATGLNVEDIAARFGLAPLFVAQRLKLANVSPTFIQLYRDAGIRLEQLEALAITDDHEAQGRVWNAAHEWERTPSALRRALAQSTVDAADNRVLFVGLETYLQRAGGIARDLFDAEHEGFLTDPNLLETLVTEKLDTEAEKLKADGWSWVEINRTEDRWRAVRTYQQLRPKSVSLSDELQQEVDRLIRERETLQSKDHADVSQDDEDRIEEINQRLATIEAATRIFTPKQKSISGVMIGISFNGKLAVDYGLTKERVSIDSDGSDSVPIKPDEPVDPHKVSGSLQEELTAQRTGAIRAALIARPDIALVAITHRLVGHFCYSYRESVPTAVMISPDRYGIETDLPITVGSKADQELTAAGEVWN